jgi:hypothetical protein
MLAFKEIERLNLRILELEEPGSIPFTSCIEPRMLRRLPPKEGTIPRSDGVLQIAYANTFLFR